jgi:hypothetical protein
MNLQLDKDAIILFVVVAFLVWYLFSSKEDLSDYTLDSDTDLNPIGAIVFEHADFKGKSVKLRLGKHSTKGQYGTQMLLKLGLPNDSISSIKVLPGFEVHSFEHDNGKGKQLTSIKSVNFRSKEWNDKVSSIEVRKLKTPIVDTCT